MMLSDRGIRDAINNHQITVRGPEPVETLIQPASIEVTLDNRILAASKDSKPVTPKDPTIEYDKITLAPASVIFPGELWLASTRETIHLSPQHAAQVGGKSSLGRLGLTVHQTAGFIDPGFHGQITLEIVNLGTRPIVLTKGMRIAQLTNWELDRAAERPYGHHAIGSHYQGQEGPTPTKGNK